MKKLMSLIAASMCMSVVAFAQVPEQNQQGTMPQQNQTTMPQQSTPQTQPQTTSPEQNQSTFPQQNQQGVSPEPKPDQTITPQQQEQQGAFPSTDTTQPAISDTSINGSPADTSHRGKKPHKW